VVGLILGLVLVTLVFTAYFQMKNVRFTRQQDERMGVSLARVFRSFIADLRGLYVYGIAAKLSADESAVTLSWTFLPGRKTFRYRKFEIFRSTERILSRDDLEKSLRIAEVPLTRRSYTDSGIVRAGEYYYAVVLRNPENQFPLLPGKNSLENGVEFLGHTSSFQADLKGNKVLLSWKAAKPSLKGKVRILRSSRIISDPAKAAVAKEVGRVAITAGRFEDTVTAKGFYYYALVPVTRKAKLLAGASFTEKAVLVGQPAGRADVLKEKGKRVVLRPTALKRANDEYGGDDRTGQSALSADEKADRASMIIVRKGVRPLANTVQSRYSRSLKELTVYFGYDYFFSTDQRRNPLPGEKKEPSGPGPVVFSDISTFFWKNQVEITTEQWQKGTALQFLGGLSAEADRGYAVKIFVKPGEPKSSLGLFLLLIAFAVLLVLLYYVYDRFIGKACIAVSLVLLLAFGLMSLKLVSRDVQSRLVRNQKELGVFYSTILTGVYRSGIYTYNLPRMEQLFSSLGSNQFNESDVLLSFDTKALAAGRDAVTLEKKAAVQNRKAVFSFSFALLIVVLLLFAAPLQYKVGKGMGERFLNALSSHRTAYLFTLPGIMILVLLVFAPLLYTFVLSTTHIPKEMHIVEMNIGRQFVGLANFGKLLGVFDLTSTSNFYWTLKTTLIYTIFTVLVQTVIGIGMAMVLNRPDLRFRIWFRTALILPWSIPTYVSALIFNYLFSSGSAGFINQLIRLFGSQPVNWLYDVNVGIVIVILASVWYGFPFIMVVALGALQSIPPHLYESADIEGASSWQKMMAITLPMIQPAVTPAIILSTVWTFNNFNFVYLINRGWEGTDILITRIYDYIDPAKTTIDYGLGAAFSTAIFVILIMYIYSLRKLTNFTEKAF